MAGGPGKVLGSVAAAQQAHLSAAPGPGRGWALPPGGLLPQGTAAGKGCAQAFQRARHPRRHLQPLPGGSHCPRAARSHLCDRQGRRVSLASCRMPESVRLGVLLSHVLRWPLPDLSVISFSHPQPRHPCAQWRVGAAGGGRAFLGAGMAKAGSCGLRIPRVLCPGSAPGASG